MVAGTLHDVWSSVTPHELLCGVMFALGRLLRTQSMCHVQALCLNIPAEPRLQANPSPGARCLSEEASRWFQSSASGHPSHSSLCMQDPRPPLRAPYDFLAHSISLSNRDFGPHHSNLSHLSSFFYPEDTSLLVFKQHFCLTAPPILH